MNDADVSKQIQQMVRFIRQEAEEKANEISVSAEEVLFYANIFFCTQNWNSRCMHGSDRNNAFNFEHLGILSKWCGVALLSWSLVSSRQTNSYE